MSNGSAVLGASCLAYSVGHSISPPAEQERLVTPSPLQLDGDVGDIDLNNYVSRYAAIIAEIRARQSQARILLFGVFPRYQTEAEPVMENAALARLGSNDTVFFIDMTSWFFRADGAFDERMWATGLQKPAFKAWAEELQPRLDRFLR